MSKRGEGKHGSFLGVNAEVRRRWGRPPTQGTSSGVVSGGDGASRARGARTGACSGHRIFQSMMGQGFECERGWQDPKGGELYPVTVKPWETAVEAGLYTDVQFVCRSLE